MFHVDWEYKEDNREEKWYNNQIAFDLKLIPKGIKNV